MKIDANTILDRAAGEWAEIHTALAPVLSSIIERAPKPGPCPLCGGTDRANCHKDYHRTGAIFCRQNQCKGGGNGLFVLMWANSWSYRESLVVMTKYFGLYNGQIPKPRSTKLVQEESHAKNWANERRRLEAVWDGSTPAHPRIAGYFDFRGLSISVPPTLRLHPSIFYYHEGPTVRYPCILAQIIRDGEMVGLHQTYLDPDPKGMGKAPCSQPKKNRKCVENMSGGAIRLYDIKPDLPLVLVEGTETALAVHQITGWPVWSTISATMMKKVQLPDMAQEVYIGGDFDKSETGQRATEELAKRLYSEGRKVWTSFPPGELIDGQKSIDWLDILNKERQGV